MTPKTNLGELPFSLALDTEAILPLEIVFPIPRIESLDEEIFEERLRYRLKLINKIKAKAHRVLRYKRMVAKLYDQGIGPWGVGLGDLILRKVEVNDPTRSRGKLAPN